MVRRLLSALALVAIIVVGLAFFEGLTSDVLSTRRLFGAHGRATLDLHAQYDPDLGWVSRPNLALTDAYGPDADLHTTARGFRGTIDPGPTPPPDKARVLCSGDSLTFGYGTGDDFTWCPLLAALDPRLEMINMGQGDYGVDQSFLWYRRDGAALAPKLHLFAVTEASLERMRTTRVGDHGKPTVALRDGVLTIENTPAWHRPFWMPTVRIRDIVKRTKTWELVAGLRQRFGGVPPAPPTVPDPAARAAVVDAALAIFTELRATAEKHGDIFVIVYLPSLAECRLPFDAPPGLDWWTTIAPRLTAATFRVLDTSGECRQRRSDQLDALFIQPGAGPDDLVGLYSPEGHLAFANTIKRDLRYVLNGIFDAPR